MTTARSLGALLVLVLMAAACSSNGTTPAGSDRATTSATDGAAPTFPILGTWRSTYSCAKLVSTARRYDLEDHLADFLPMVGVRGGAAEGSGSDPCEGARKIERTHFFRPNGYLINYQGKKIVDDCRCYQLVDDHTFVSLGEGSAPDISLDFRIDGDTLTFRAVEPVTCSTAACRGDFAFAVFQYAVGPWHRVDGAG